MKRLLVLVGCLAALLAPAAAQAHPLGNFTVNRHTAIELSGGRIYVQLRARPGRDPDLPGGEAGSRGRLRRARPAAGSSSGSTASARRSASSSTARRSGPARAG